MSTQQFKMSSGHIGDMRIGKDKHEKICSSQTAFRAQLNKIRVF